MRNQRGAKGGGQWRGRSTLGPGDSFGERDVLLKSESMREVMRSRHQAFAVTYLHLHFIGRVRRPGYLQFIGRVRRPGRNGRQLTLRADPAHPVVLAKRLRNIPV